MSKKNSVSKRKKDHQSLLKREAVLAKKRAEKLKRRKEKKENSEDVVMADVTVGGKRVVRKKAIRRKINEIRRLANKGTISREQERELVADLSIPANE